MVKRLFDTCPNCNKDYDSIDHEYQICRWCGFDASPMKLVIAGSRKFADYELLKCTAVQFICNRKVEVVSGTAGGADQLGERFAKEMGFPVKQFPADWNKHGKSAGPIRNAEMAKYATHCICFWDGKSRGTKSMIDLCDKYKVHIQVIIF